MANRFVCIYCNRVSRKYRQVCDTCGRYVGVVNPKMTTLGYLMIVFIILALVMLALPWIPFTNDIIGNTIGGLICILPLPTIVIALVFNVLDDKKRDEEALKIAHMNYKTQYDQWTRQNYQSTKTSKSYVAKTQAQQKTISQKKRPANQKRIAQQNRPTKTPSKTTQKKPKETKKTQPPPPPPPPPPE